jgi:hypothetical protein
VPGTVIFPKLREADLVRILDGERRQTLAYGLFGLLGILAAAAD